MTQLSYDAAGVSIDNGDELVERIKPFAKRTLIPGVLGSIGGFGALFEISKEYKEPVLVSGTDGVGTKLMLAFKLNRHDTVGQDLVAMSVNDVLVQGAKNVFFLDYFSCGKLDVSIAERVVKGVAHGCELAGCALIGGETAEMAGFYAKGDYDVAGFAVGIVDKKDLITGETIAPGDVILGLPSTGVHSNGYSLVRRIIEDNNLSLKETYEGFDKPLGEVLLTPTRLYPRPVLPVLKGADVKGLVHITGGGFYDNIPRVLPRGTRAVLNADLWPMLPVFPFLKNLGGVDPHEMYRTYNCGLGMLLILTREEAEKAKEILASINEPVYEVGEITEGSQDVIVTGGLFNK